MKILSYSEEQIKSLLLWTAQKEHDAANDFINFVHQRGRELFNFFLSTLITWTNYTADFDMKLKCNRSGKILNEISILIYSMKSGGRQFSVTDYLGKRGTVKRSVPAIKCNITLNWPRCSNLMRYVVRTGIFYIRNRWVYWIDKNSCAVTGGWSCLDLNEDSSRKKKLILISLGGEYRDRNFMTI